MTARALLLAFSIASLAACSGEDPADSSLVWQATVDGAPETLRFESTTAESRADGGIRIALEGVRGTQEVRLTIELGGSVEVSIPKGGTATFPLGGVDVNVRLKLGADRFRATSGTLSISAYGATAGAAIRGSLNANLVPSAASSTASVSLSGGFSAEVGG